MDPQELLEKLDSPLVSQFLFHPRPQYPSPVPPSGRDMTIPTNDGVQLGARIYLADKDSHNILFFHGNGEIAADYDDIGPIYTSLGISFLVVDYRGYGKSEGSPSVSSMLTDAQTVFDHVWSWLKREGRTKSLWIMGRSLGSASALEIAASRQPEINGVIIESGFAQVVPLLRTIGVNTMDMGLTREDDPVANLAKMAVCKKPALVIHAEHDHIIPLSHGKNLHEACPAPVKQFFMVQGADHNDIMYRAGREYFTLIQSFLEQNS
ncbi:alpha/beta hydrolase [Desulfatibacillum aliphaticivorans]|uniref:Temperature sensitive supressor-like protein n=1 Tax=Desulfatibacillum aliphaticivorans TaxID=218208 RepID=B8FBP8_DESAL|nr:alpha/beta hydrolase [Desulfatibacillum aliphaticivorans]ACL04801.1 temperature sensitive supressor-like protein [Desulfatibacillum aliphaticivorans]